MYVKEHIEFTHQVISNTCLQSEVGIAGGYSKDWVATKPKFFFFFAIICTVQDISLLYLFYFLFQNSPKILDLSYKIGIDFWACFRKENLFR